MPRLKLTDIRMSSQKQKKAIKKADRYNTRQLFFNYFNE